jgi:hypothetical protein
MRLNMNPLAQEANGFTEKMREELSLLQQQVEAHDTDSSFPWDKYNNLRRAAHEHAQAFRVVKRPYPGDIVPVLGYGLNHRQEAIEDTGETPSLEALPFIEAIQPVEVPQMLSAPVSDSAPAAEKKKISAPSLESMCKGADEDKRREYVAKIDSMMTYTQGKTWARYHGAAGAAVYKMAVWLGMVYEDVTFSQWGAMLLDRYAISVSEPISKYRIDKPQASSSPFRKAVLAAFSFAQSNSAIMAKKNPLPPIYQRIPPETGVYQE